MSAAAQPQAAAGTDRQSRSASRDAVKVSSGFHVFRIVGYSLAKKLPGGERISSQDFWVGGRRWRVDLYPNGTNSSKDDESGSIALYLILVASYGGGCGGEGRLAATYRFSLLDAGGGAAAYELPAEKGFFTSSGDGDQRGCGHAAFISREKLEGRRAASLLKGDCLAVRCDVGGVLEVETRPIVGGKRGRYGSSFSDYGSDSDDEPPRRSRCGRRSRSRQPQLSDAHYIPQCLDHGRSA